MIKIRYSDLPQGRHAHVHAAGRRSVIYLLPGLFGRPTADALRPINSHLTPGVRATAPGSGVRFAVARDVARPACATRWRPSGAPRGSTALAAFIAAGVICYAFFVTVTVRFGPHPAPAGRGAVRAAGPRGPGTGKRRQRPGRDPAPGHRAPHCVSRAARNRRQHQPWEEPRDWHRAVG